MIESDPIKDLHNALDRLPTYNNLSFSPSLDLEGLLRQADIYRQLTADLHLAARQAKHIDQSLRTVGAMYQHARRNRVKVKKSL